MLHRCASAVGNHTRRAAHLRVQGHTRTLCAPAEPEAVPKKKKKKKTKPYKVDPMTPPPCPSSFDRKYYEPRDFFRFEIVHESKKPGSRARVGKIHTPHGIIHTPSYVAVGTNGTLKALDHPAANETGLDLMFCNTYHLLLQPGPDIIEEAGGLHKFIRRDKPIITDSGGFQVFSLAHGSVHDEINMKARSQSQKKHDATMLKVTEEGALFRNYRNGHPILLTPESSVQAQKKYGSDIIIPLDVLPPYHIDKQALLESVYMTHRWEARSLRTHLADIRQQAMYCVLHGGVDEEIRRMSIEYLTALPFDGLAVGGSLGKDRQELIKLLQFVMPLLPKEKPVHLLGIADEPSIVESVPLGVDTFDSCFPTRLGRHGTLLTKEGRLHIKKGKYAHMHEPIPGSILPHTMAYLHHLFKANEPVAWQLYTMHNLHYMVEMMAEQRQLIMEDKI